MAFLPTALAVAPRNPYVYHNAVCLTARLGDLERTLALVGAAKEHGYEKFAVVRTDEDLRALWDDPRFTALFDAS